MLSLFYSNIKNDVVLASHQYWLGRLLCQNGSRKEGRTYLLQALKMQPANFKNLLAIFLSFLGGRFSSKIEKKFIKIGG